MDVFEITKKLIDIPSVTGAEGNLFEFLTVFLRNRGFEVRGQVVEADRKNLIAVPGGQPKVLLCTHLDTVAPFIPASEDDRYIYGRGACDAKGSLAAMISAASQLLNSQVTDFGLLFVVGEETDSLGARRAARLKLASDYIVVGEPTDNRLGRGHKGIVMVRLLAQGRSAHSSYPGEGDSAVLKLLDALHRLRASEWEEDENYGPAHVNIGVLEGGVSANVVAPSARAEFSLRSGLRAAEALRRIEEACGADVEIEILAASDPQTTLTLPGWKHTALPFGTDIPYLKSLGSPLLLGPGSGRFAHSEKEKVPKKHLIEAVDLYARLVRELVSLPSAGISGGLER